MEVFFACLELLRKWCLNRKEWTAVSECVHSIMNHSPLGRPGQPTDAPARVWRVPIEVITGHRPVSSRLQALLIGKYRHVIINFVLKSLSISGELERFKEVFEISQQPVTVPLRNTNSAPPLNPSNMLSGVILCTEPEQSDTNCQFYGGSRPACSLPTLIRYNTFTQFPPERKRRSTRDAFDCIELLWTGNLFKSGLYMLLSILKCDIKYGAN